MIKKFHAQNTRDALRQVRDALGASAIILSNRQVAGGIEIIAVADMDMAALTSQAEPALWAAARDSRPVRPPETTAPVQKPPVSRTAAAIPDEAKPQLASLAEYLAQKEEASLIRPSPARAAHASNNGSAGTAEATSSPPAAVQELAREVRLLRGLVEGQLAGFAWNDLTRRDPLRAEAMKRLLAAGFSPAFARQMLGELGGVEDQVPARVHGVGFTRDGLGRRIGVDFHDEQAGMALDGLLRREDAGQVGEAGDDVLGPGQLHLGEVVGVGQRHEQRGLVDLLQGEHLCAPFGNHVLQPAAQGVVVGLMQIDPDALGHGIVGFEADFQRRLQGEKDALQVQGRGIAAEQVEAALQPVHQQDLVAVRHAAQQALRQRGVAVLLGGKRGLHVAILLIEGGDDFLDGRGQALDDFGAKIVGGLDAVQGGQIIGHFLGGFGRVGERQSRQPSLNLLGLRLQVYIPPRFTGWQDVSG